MTYAVLICDDEFEQAEEWVDGVKAIAPAETYNIMAAPSTEDVRVGVKELLGRRSAAETVRRGKGRAAFLTLSISLSSITTLSTLKKTGRSTPVKEVARLARTFAGCPVVVVLNQFEGIDFDLSLRDT